ncbi:universal stress protein [Halobacterium salinarum]|uniref:Nucleotide-binding universal stress protein, UspA family n=1 Tax=Halobacterium salinarum (strain ATCC 33171 / DSM 3754 / JCM 8978 / NBRC 102687 / NCIMB 764 / 91-R6) TaxID=2597657 RepID=A0A4D6GRP4_HALS9|nr:universal stress protein [Halobacterium salinarum]MDL0120669.1 universal stress protein [Halobacterium salinarum]MDL0123902.1 universal stress protein [Halobacterium salinarum]MDL0130546.1 universal stress protein [Halobacterium salinarum]MDL0136504.1 universal stress protein [Halobacterium salinarum]MDL0141594.1 universal stress protein [Halobacterium salinarum]
MYDRVCLATNGGVASENAETHALNLAAAMDATLHAVYVVDEAVTTAYSGDEYVDTAEGPAHGLTEYGNSVLGALAERADAAGVTIETAVLYGSPADEIVTVADEVDADIVILGTKRRSDEYRSLLGSVTDRVLRVTDRSTTVVKTNVSDEDAP